MSGDTQTGGGSAGRRAAPPPLPSLPLLREVPPEIAQRHAARHATWTQAGPGQALLDFADATDDVFFVASGAVRVVVRTPGGKELLLDDIGAGGFFGEMSAIDGAPRSASVTALNSAAICRLSGQGFRALLDDSPALARAVMKLLVKRVRDGNARLLQLATLDSRQRVHAELLRAAGPAAADGTRAISPPPVQQALANRIGTSREAVSREVARLLREGLLARRRGALVLTDPARLAAGLED